MAGIKAESKGRAGKTGLYPSSLPSDWAISRPTPSARRRLLHTRDQIFEEGLMDLPQIAELKPRLATLKDIARTHFCVPDVESQITEAHLVAEAAP